MIAQENQETHEFHEDFFTRNKNKAENNKGFFYQPETKNEEAGICQETPSHLRGLKDYELEFLTLRNNKTHRCK